MRPQHLLPLLLLLLAPAIHAAVLAIDYGAEFTKLSLIKPGVPFDVVLDKDSKRKIASVVGWKRDERVFGAEAKMAATRFPDTHYPFIKPLLGTTTPNTFPVYPVNPHVTNDTLYFPHPSPPSYISPELVSPEDAWTPTALLAQQLSYFRHLAELVQPAGSKKESVNSVIVTVPAWWDQAQRRAYRDALELQGMNCLAMISEGTGVALNYAMTRTFPNYDPVTGQGEKEYHIVYDSGAMTTTATVFAFYQTSEYATPKSKTPINTTHIEVLGTGWEHIGGVMLDTVIQDMLLTDFVGKTKREEVRQDKKALAKIAKEATRVKQILSANQEANVAIESLFDDVDFRSTISRADLEEIVGAADQLYGNPVVSALEAAGLQLGDINSVILFGGNTRVPLVQAALKSVLGGAEDKIAQNVNTDEAAVLGAAYYGAALSKQFRIKNIDIKERSVSEIAFKNGGAIFPEGTVLGERKAITLPAKGDVTLEFTERISHPDSAHASSREPQSILSVEVHDVEKALADFTAPEPVINITMRLDPKGHVSAANAVLVSNVTDSKDGGVAGALKNLFGSKEEEAKEGEEDDKEQKDTKGKSPKVALKFREKHLGLKPLSGEEKRTTNARIISISAFEAAKASREEARNSLESYLYALQNSLNVDDGPTALTDFSTPAEQQALKKLLGETFEWLGENDEVAEEPNLRRKLAELEGLERPVVFRYNEYRARDKAVADFQQAMLLARAFLIDAQANYTKAMEAAATATPEDPVAPPKHTEEELKGVEALLKEYTQFIDEKMKVQVTLDQDKTKDPVITVRELEEKGRRLQATILTLQKKKTPRKPRPTTSSSSATSSTTLASPTDHDPSPDVTESPSDVSSTTLASPTDHGPSSETSSAAPTEGSDAPRHEEL
ncbi:hypoxia up-regulated 1 [Cryptococcus neoformans C23]|uniref:Hypoxia up-regulated 1 n=1 Tax=Cryptococcus neoformans (strain H99 / ATCC 208821 / CBS 10515 / FGSC 9487) TaxID=235443 RepID=J9VLF7_CRYN9|nr:hypoxia up-regulated 1 [Cryptococcus neoformans var. grubii H99]AUB22942.1 hypoxia up-regulated 1 [Cryptococcus neoformans var. grubii]OWZ34794.1 hypoxia up-regulated 1 [Cryptococcus neoformans var. grubii AD2-60a]OWZ46893.1 hypoxia up-regulated 1 [Cryptococcus neoformans var. grubii C23]OXC86386.1 hypoxia up-regulated 1 [Cryptococcus neoformans var. grubii AD1-7a]OXG38898.1 hypoxia up-regulated 1 [Cryptococcus neoformans var. grubii Bt15]OXG44718.1 hypoxia up-regulated 1 [Cryptococcus neo|eukprot:XP_012047536.1 hypoxia up-regulated 1 [Cryptococcus neoformans var. grubii H99]